MKRSVMLFSVFVFVVIASFLTIRSVSAGTCLVPSVGCLEADNGGCSQLGGTYLGDGSLSSYSECTVGCCEVNDSQGKIFYTQEYDDQPVQNYTCHHISSFTDGTYHFVKFYNNNEQNPCQTCSATQTGFSTCRGCDLHINLSISDQEGYPLNADWTLIIYKDGSEIKRFSQSSEGMKGSFPIIRMDDCSKLTGLSYSLSVSKEGYVAHEENSVPINYQQSHNLNLRIILHKPTNYWNFTFNSNLNSFGLIANFLGENKNILFTKQYFVQNKKLSIPLNSSVYYINFTGYYSGYTNANTVVSIEVNKENYDVTLNFAKKTRPQYHVNVCSNENAMIYVYSQSGNDVFSNQTERSGSGDFPYCAGIGIHDPGKYYFGAYKEGYYSSTVLKQIPSNNQEIDLTLSHSSAPVCTGIKVFSMTPNSPCFVPCRKTYTYNCTYGVCDFNEMNDRSNWIVNAEQPGICSGDFMCNYEGNCVPKTNTCQHQGNLNDCLKTNLLGGFEYCNQSNQIQFINLTKMYNGHNYYDYVAACEKCPMDSECHVCNNPEPALNIFSEYKTCNLAENATCEDSLLTDNDLSTISRNQALNPWKKYNLSKPKDYFDYCVLSQCGAQDPDCELNCSNLSTILQENGESAVECKDPSDLALIYPFGNCSNGQSCGVPKENVCYGSFLFSNPNIGGKADYLCLAQGSTISVKNGNVKCCGKPMPMNIPACPVGKKLSSATLTSEISSYFNSTSSSYSFGSHRADVYCKCNFQYANFASNKYCCAYGLSDTPCQQTYSFSATVNHCYYDNDTQKYDLCVPAKNFNFDIKSANGYEVFVSTDANGKINNVIMPQGKYNITLIHGFLKYNSSFNLNQNINNFIINVTDDGSHVKLWGHVYGVLSQADSQGNNKINLTNIDLTLNLLNLYSMTDGTGKYDFGYFEKRYTPYLNLTINTLNEFFETKNISVDLSNVSSILGYDIDLNQRGNTSVIINVTDQLGKGVNATYVGFPNLVNVDPSDIPQEYKNVNFSGYTNKSGIIVFSSIPCGKHVLVAKKLGFLNYKNDSVYLQCGMVNVINIQLNPLHCIEQTAKPKITNISIDENGNVDVNWSFACPKYALGFYVYSYEDGKATNVVGNQKGNLVSKLIKTTDGYYYTYHYNLKDLGYDMNLWTLPNSSVLSRTFRVDVLWEKPYVKFSSSQPKTYNFNYNCIKKMWYRNFCAYKFNDYFPQENDLSYGDNDTIYSCYQSAINLTGGTPVSSCLTNKGNPIDFSIPSDSNKGFYGKVVNNNYDPTVSFYCNGPLNAFANYYQSHYTNNCSLLPYDKGQGAEDNYKTCGQIHSCYDYRTEQACSKNTCLPYGCHWNSIKDLNSSLNVSYDVGVCVPDDANLINCTEYQNYLQDDSNIFFLKRPDIMCPLFGDLNNSMFYGGMRCKYQGGTDQGIQCISERNPLFYDCTVNSNISNPYSHDYLDYSFCKPDHHSYLRLNYHRGAVGEFSMDWNNPYYDTIPPKFFFENKYVYKSMQELNQTLYNVSSYYGIFDYDILGDVHFTPDYSIKKVSSADFRSSRANWPQLFDATAFTSNSAGISKGYDINYTLADEANNSYAPRSSIVEVDDIPPKVTWYRTIKQRAYVSQLNSTFYDLGLSLSVSNEDWVTVTGSLYTNYFYFDGKQTGKIMVKNFSIDDGLSVNRDYDLYSANYSGFVSTTDLQTARQYALLDSTGIAQVLRNIPQNSELFLLPAGEYTLTWNVQDKVHNSWQKTYTFILPRFDLNYTIGYLRTYSSLPFNLSLEFNESLASCRLSSTEENYVSMPLKYSFINPHHFTFEVNASNFGTLFGHTFDDYKNNLLTIYTKCKDQYGNTIEVPPIYVSIDKTKPNLLFTRTNPSDVRTYFDDNYGMNGLSNQGVIYLSGVDPTKEYYLLCKDPAIPGSSQYYNSSLNDTEKPFEPFVIPGEFGCGEVKVENITAEVDVLNTTYDYRTILSSDGSYAKVGLRFKKSGLFNVTWCDLGGNCRVQEYNVTLDHGTPVAKDFRFDDALCEDSNGYYLLKRSTTIQSSYGLSYDLLNVHKSYDHDTLTLNNLKNAELYLYPSTGIISFNVTYSGSTNHFNLTLNNKNLTMNYGVVKHITNINYVLMNFTNGRVDIFYDNSTIYEPRKLNSLYSISFDSIENFSESNLEWYLLTPDSETKDYSYVSLGTGVKTTLFITNDLFDNVKQTIYLSNSMSAGKHSFSVMVGDDIHSPKEPSLKSNFDFYTLPVLSSIVYSHDNVNTEFDVSQGLNYACYASDLNMFMKPIMNWNGWDPKFWSMRLIVWNQSGIFDRIPLENGEFNLSSLPSEGRYTFAINLSTNGSSCKPFSQMLPRFTLYFKVCKFPKIKSYYFETKLANFSKPLTVSQGDVLIDTDRVKGLFCNYEPSRAWFTFDTKPTTFNNLTVTCENSQGFREILDDVTATASSDSYDIDLTFSKPLSDYTKCTFDFKFKNIVGDVDHEIQVVPVHCGASVQPYLNNIPTSSSSFGSLIFDRSLYDYINCVNATCLNRIVATTLNEKGGIVAYNVSKIE